jgi:1-acyl-sn-glycerol-3-phosphate acyltransferase
LITISDFPKPYPVQFKGSRLARALLRLAGWRVHFEGLPGLQGVLVVYPHTSNWDFVVMVLAKWSVGVPVCFWSKDRLFCIPLFGRWLRWLGGVPVDRTSPTGITAHAVDVLRERGRAGQYFWLALAPEGTRKYLPGLRSGFYRTAVGAGVPLGLAKLDYGRREVTVLDFMALSGDARADVARMAAVYRGVQGRVPGRAAPLVLLDPSVPRADTIVQP